MKRLFGGAGAALAAKLMTGFAVAALAAAGAGAAGEVATTGSLNPSDWGAQVMHQVATCRAALTTGQHGIGECVSAFAKQHGDLVSDQHQSATGARHSAGHGTGSNSQTANHGKPSGLPHQP